MVGNSPNQICKDLDVWSSKTKPWMNNYIHNKKKKWLDDYWTSSLKMWSSIAFTNGSQSSCLCPIKRLQEIEGWKSIWVNDKKQITLIEAHFLLKLFLSNNFRSYFSSC